MISSSRNVAFTLNRRDNNSQQNSGQTSSLQNIVKAKMYKIFCLDGRNHKSRPKNIKNNRYPSIVRLMMKREW